MLLSQHSCSVTHGNIIFSVFSPVKRIYLDDTYCCLKANSALLLKLSLMEENGGEGKAEGAVRESQLLGAAFSEFSTEIRTMGRSSLGDIGWARRTGSGLMEPACPQHL